jgi:Protein of unknown function (DUF2512).
MTGLLLKIILCPVAVSSVAYLLSNHVYYPSFIYPVGIGLLIAIMGHTIEVVLLQQGSVWLSTIIDMMAVALLSYFSQFIIHGSYVTFGGAFITALVIGISEHLQHTYLVADGKAKKGD